MCVCVCVCVVVVAFSCLFFVLVQFISSNLSIKHEECVPVLHYIATLPFIHSPEVTLQGQYKHVKIQLLTIQSNSLDEPLMTKYTFYS